MVGKNYKLFPKCRSAIHAALSHYDLQPDDMVSVFTTSGNTYISGCVTKAIEKTCKWSMKIEDNTKVIVLDISSSKATEVLYCKDSEICKILGIGKNRITTLKKQGLGEPSP